MVRGGFSELFDCIAAEFRNYAVGRSEAATGIARLQDAHRVQVAKTLIYAIFSCSSHLQAAAHDLERTLRQRAAAAIPCGSRHQVFLKRQRFPSGSRRVPPWVTSVRVDVSL